MSRAFQYRPKFVDIRIRPPKEGEAAAEADVHALKPGEKPCEHAGCRAAATARAPKSRDMPGEYYDFCQAHAAEYNKSWNYWAGLSEAEIRRRQEQEQTGGGRPTWTFKASNTSREAAAFAAKMGTGNTSGAGMWTDAFGMFGGKRRAAQAPEAARRLGRMERNALADLDLDETAVSADIRRAYLDLVKRCHPDSNGGDRGAEEKLQRVIKAYKTLQNAKMV